MICSICIPTYKRPLLLKKLLENLFAQELSEEIEVEIIVVDNDVEESAREVCNMFSRTGKINFFYFTQPEKNISLTRNKAVNNATGEYILFIDDDETVSPDWINAFLITFDHYDADILIGRVIFQFEDHVPNWLRKYFAIKYPSQTTGSKPNQAYTGNCALKSSIINSIDGPFNPDLGLTGGEDSMLFEMLENKGAKIVYCYEATATEMIPSESSNLKWILDRAFRQGFFTIYNGLKYELGMKNNIFFRVLLSIKALLYLVISILLVLITFFNMTYRVYWLTKVVSNWAHLLAAIGYKPKIFLKLIQNL